MSLVDILIKIGCQNHGKSYARSYLTFDHNLFQVIPYNLISDRIPRPVPTLSPCGAFQTK